MNDPLDALAFYLVFVAAVTCHEAAHAWAAKMGGDLTAYRGGQVSLDPIPHMKREPIGMVLLPLICVSTLGWPLGYASTPYDPAWARSHPRRAAWMALAGPAANLALLLLAALLIRVGLAADVFHLPESVSFGAVAASSVSPTASVAAMLLSVFFCLNLVLFALNLIPVPPLDGYGALGLLLPQDLTLRYEEMLARSGVGWFGILIAWWIFSQIFDPIFWVAVSLLYPEVSYG